MPDDQHFGGKDPNSLRPVIGTKGERTRSLVVVALLQIVQSLGILAFGLYTFSESEGGGLFSELFFRFTPFALFEGVSSGWFYLLLAGLLLIVAFALFQRRTWAWNAAITLQGIGLMTALVGYMRGQPNYIGMVTGIILVLYLNLDDVQAAFLRN